MSRYVHRGQTYLTAGHSQLRDFCGMAKTMASLQAFPSSLLPRARSRALIPYHPPLPLRTPATQATTRPVKEPDGKKKISKCHDYLPLFLLSFNCPYIAMCLLS